MPAAGRPPGLTSACALAAAAAAAAALALAACALRARGGQRAPACCGDGEPACDLGGELGGGKGEPRQPQPQDALAVLAFSLPCLRVRELLRCCGVARAWREEVGSWRDGFARQAGADAMAIHARLDAAEREGARGGSGPQRGGDALQLALALADDALELGWRAPRLLQAQDCAGRPPLMRAAQLGSVPLVTALLNARADVAARGAQGWTALHAAAACARVQACRELLVARADAEARTSDGRTPLFYAHRTDGGGGEAVARLLRESGSRIGRDIQDFYGFQDQ